MTHPTLNHSSARENTSQPDALLRLIADPNSEESKRILERVGRRVNEEQRKIYYGDTQKSEA